MRFEQVYYRTLDKLFTPASFIGFSSGKLNQGASINYQDYEFLPTMDIRPFSEDDRRQVVRLWKTVFADDPPHNEPDLVISAKLKVDELLFVAVEQGNLIGTVMVGYDGHRGWLYSVAVDPQQQRKGIGRQLVDHALSALRELGCIKVNLQVRSGNTAVVAFYRKLGFSIEDRVSMGLLI